MKAPGLGATDKAAAAKAEIEHLLSLSPGEVRVLWRKRFRRDIPRALTTQLLVRMLAWKVQEEAFGGHDGATLKLLKAFADQDADKVVLFRKLKPGTTVIREYQGIRHIVTITEGGFVWEGRTYSSLSAILNRSLFEAVQAKMAANYVEKRRRDGSSPHLLTG